MTARPPPKMLRLFASRRFADCARARFCLSEALQFLMRRASAMAKSPTPSAPPAFAHDKLLIVDFGSQVTQLIARRVREAGVYCEIAPFQSAERAFAELKPKAVILSGGPASVPDEGSPRAPQAIFDSKVPVLGICYGQMVMAEQLGGGVESGHHREFGRAEVAVGAASPLLEGVWKPGESHTVWMSHGDRITRLPPGFARVGDFGERPLRADRG